MIDLKKWFAICLTAILLMSFSVLAEEEKSGFWNSVGGAFDSAWNWAKGAAEDTWDWTENAAGDAWDWAENAAGDVWNWTENAAGDVWDWTENAAGDAWNWTTGAAIDVWEWTTGVAGDIWAWTSGKATDAWQWTTALFSGETDEEEIAEDLRQAEIILLDPNAEKFYFDCEPVNAGKNTGYSENHIRTIDDPHFGWELGKFLMSGYTATDIDKDGTRVFLKVSGDKLALSYCLEQNIDSLNGDADLTIAEDKNGYDQYFGIPKTDFGRGTMLIKETNYQNLKTPGLLYTDFLSAKVSENANTIVQLFEEGDYEVALDYEIREGGKLFPSYSDYRTTFKFKVRNGNCMIFLFDTVTGSELKDMAITGNGFRIDSAQSKYLSIDVKYSKLVKGIDDKIVEDIRFNKPAKDGDEFSQSGIYVITVSNQYTGESTRKQIYVGNEQKMEDYILSGLSIEQIIDSLNR